MWRRVGPVHPWAIRRAGCPQIASIHMVGTQISGTSVAVVLLFVEVNASCERSISRSVEEQRAHAVACIPRIARRGRTDAGSRRACLRHTKSDFRLQGSPYRRAPVYVARVPRNVRIPTLQITRTAISTFGAILGSAWESTQKHIHCLDWERRTFVAPRPGADWSRPTPGVVTHGTRFSHLRIPWYTSASCPASAENEGTPLARPGRYVRALSPCLRLLSWRAA
ncbi:hypothetical protein C8Q79DRAFT_761829 [Trametes meyenii]|nr:hypothetical protein C8Q79DRAFT_761829 [Trametes meyenii]